MNHSSTLAHATAPVPMPDVVADFVNDLLLPTPPPIVPVPSASSVAPPATRPVVLAPPPVVIPPSPLSAELAASLDSFNRLFEMPEVEQHRPQAPPSLRCVSFQLGGQQYALEVAHLIEVLAQAEVMPIPDAPTAVLGVINLRGNIIPVLNPCLALGHVPAPAEGGQYIVAEHGQQPVALQVGRVQEVVSIAESSLRPPPIGSGPVKGLTAHRQDLLTVLDLGALIRAIAGRIH